MEQLRGDDDGLVRDDPGDGLLAAGLGQAPLVLDELRLGGDEGGERHRLQAGPRASINHFITKMSLFSIFFGYSDKTFSI